MIYRDNIVFTDRDGDVLSVAARSDTNPVPDPTISITHYLSKYDKEGGHSIMNSGRTQSIIFTEDEFRAFMKDLWERVLGEEFPDA